MNSLVAMVDSVMVSNVGEAAISAVSLVGTAMAVVWALFGVLVVGGSILTSQYIGAGRYSEANHSTGQLMLIHLVPMLFIYPTAFFLNGSLRAVNDGIYTMLVSMGSMLILRIGMARILCVGLECGVIGTWTAMICDWLCRSVFFFVRYKSGKWKKRCQLI